MTTLGAMSWWEHRGVDSWWAKLVDGARLLAQARAEEGAKVAAMPPAPKGQHYTRLHHEGLVLVDTLFRAGDAVVQRPVRAKGYEVIDARTGLAYRGPFVLLRNAKRLAMAYAKVDRYFERAGAGDVRAYMTITRMSRISHQWEKGR